MGYVEVHHVVPRCMGGSDDASNLVALTPEEHFVAHELLHKMHPDQPKLAFAVLVMLGNPHGQRKNKLYGWLRKSVAKRVSVSSLAMWQDPEYRSKHKAAMDEVWARPGYREYVAAALTKTHKGRVKSPQERANITKGKTGLKYKPMSAESRANMAAARCKVWVERKARGEHLLIAAKTKATRVKNGSYNFSDEHLANITAANRRMAEERKAGLLR